MIAQWLSRLLHRAPKEAVPLLPQLQTDKKPDDLLAEVHRISVLSVQTALLLRQQQQSFLQHEEETRRHREATEGVQQVEQH